MLDVAGGVHCREDVAQRRGYSDRSNAAYSTSLKGKLIGGYRTGINAACYRVAIRDSRIATFANKLVWAR